eukprot:scaffold3978_cov291-Pinguiococcus_pyrenoidosus.AAC.22
MRFFLVRPSKAPKAECKSCGGASSWGEASQPASQPPSPTCWLACAVIQSCLAPGVQEMKYCTPSHTKGNSFSQLNWKEIRTPSTSK